LAVLKFCFYQGSVASFKSSEAARPLPQRWAVLSEGFLLRCAFVNFGGCQAFNGQSLGLFSSTLVVVKRLIARASVAGFGVVVLSAPNTVWRPAFTPPAE